MSNNVTSIHNYFQDRKELHLLTWAESSSGLSSEAIWTVECKVAGDVKGTGHGASKSEAKQDAAGKALKTTKTLNLKPKGTT